jgi:hypothetical protein
VVEALRFLVDEWLCDVAAGFAGRVVLLAYALTVIERVLLPERPAFFVTAGQRGGGKTTVSQWSWWRCWAGARRRRPGRLGRGAAQGAAAYLGEGVATLVWDNIERGTAISCPSIEKALTAAEFTDRVLGVSRLGHGAQHDRAGLHRQQHRAQGRHGEPLARVPPGGGAPGPGEPRLPPPDPVGWTLRQPRPDPAGALHPAALEPAGPGAAAERPLQDPVQGVVGPRRRAARARRDAGGRGAGRGRGGGVRRRRAVPLRPEPVDFGALFAAGEAEEEETSGIRELVLLLRESFGDGLFRPPT